MKSSSSVVMFFSPYAGLWPHAMPEALVAGALSRSKSDVIYAVCNGMYAEGCYVMSGQGLFGDSAPTERERVCQQCRKQRDLLSANLNARTVIIDDFLEPFDLARIESLINEVTIENLEEFQFEGLFLGRYAIHETILRYKLTSLDEVTAIAFQDFRLKLKHVLMTYFVGKNLLRTFSPDQVVTYNTHVSTNHTIMRMFEHFGIPTYGLHAGGNMSNRLASLYIFRREMVSLYKEWITRFIDEWRFLPTIESGVVNATQHFLAVTAGKMAWAYSAPKSMTYFDVRKYFGIRPEQKILLATLSSYDELFSGQITGMMPNYSLVFSTQVEWIRELIAFVKQRDNLFLIVRVHPRELPNKRDSVHSKHAAMLEKELQNLPDNVKINWPSDEISLYDLIPQVDVGLNGWSSAGKELALHGIPVVIYTKDILHYPHTLNLLGNTKEHYFECIDLALAEGWSFDRVKQVYRWLAVEYTLGTISIKDRFDRPEAGLSLFQRVLNRIQWVTQRLEAKKIGFKMKEEKKIVSIILEDASAVVLNLEEVSRLNEDVESLVVRREMGRILDSVYKDIPQGFSKTIDSLRQVVKHGA